MTFQNRNNNKRKIYFIIIALNILVMIFFVSLNHFSDRINTHNKHLTYSITNIKYLTVQSHLWLEEYLNGDENKLSKIEFYLHKSISEMDILLNGGEIRGFKYNQKHNDETIINAFIKIKQQLIEIQILKNKRIDKISDYASLDNQFDDAFNVLIESLNEVDSYVVEKFKKMFSKYTNIKQLIYISMMFIVFLGVYLIKKLNREIKEQTLLSSTDSLTTIQNLKGYKETISQLFYLYERYNISFAIIMFDIDDFKQINDTYGHRVGDDVLIELTKLVNENIRHEADSLFRVGGEEFVVLCSETSLEKSKVVAEKIREIVEKNLTTIEDKVITISLGVTKALENDNEDLLYKRVDKNLYNSKTNGKNMVTFS